MKQQISVPISGKNCVKRRTNLYRIKEKNSKQIGTFTKDAILVYACYISLKEIQPNE